MTAARRDTAVRRAWPTDADARRVAVHVRTNLHVTSSRHQARSDYLIRPTRTRLQRFTDGGVARM
jgi:hypothetical protein